MFRVRIKSDCRDVAPYYVTIDTDDYTELFRQIDSLLRQSRIYNDYELLGCDCKASSEDKERAGHESAKFADS